MSRDITPAQAKKAGEEPAQIARKVPRPTSPLLLAVKKFVPRDRYGVIYTTHYKEGGMRCKLYGASISRIPRGLTAWLATLGYKNISIIGQQPGFRHPCVTILASFGDQHCGPRSPVMRAKKGKAAQQKKPAAKKACPCCGRAYK